MDCYTITYFKNYGDQPNNVPISNKDIDTFTVEALDQNDALSIFVENYSEHRSIRKFLMNMYLKESTLSSRRHHQCREALYIIHGYITDFKMDPNDDIAVLEMITYCFDDIKDLLLCVADQEPSWISVQPCKSLFLGSYNKSTKVR
jgi:hypothetical protein